MKNINELTALRDKFKNSIAIRTGDTAAANGEKHVLVCGGTGCHSSGCNAILKKLKESLKTHGLEDKIKVVVTGCHGLCALGPLIITHPDEIFYELVEPDDIEEIVTKHLIGGEPVLRKVYHEAIVDGKLISFHETDFFKYQHKISLKNCGIIDPECIEEYIARDGYQALAKALTTMTPLEVIDMVKASGIRGRGGAGFLTGRKWAYAYLTDSDKKYVVCNADEGDPGAFMDRSILEGDPHAVIEAMAIAGYAIKADEGFVYVRAEYPIAVNRFEIALKQARDFGLLGTDIFGTGFNFDINIRLGAGAFVCGEETALLTSIEGHRGEPRPRPPFPAIKGLFGKPTILNNVETFACIPPVILNGPEWLSKLGTENSTGTKVFALGGKIKNIGLVEVPMGTTLRTVAEQVGGGIPNGKAFKAAQTGGPSGGCIPAELFDIPIDFDNLLSIGSMMGSGGMIIMDEDNCMVDIARYFLDFTVEESCGKCTPCRIGTQRMMEILENITEGRGEVGDLEKLEELGEHIKASSLCGLGMTAPNPILSTIKYFRHEYETHINDKKCASGVCKALFQYVINEKCIGCTICKRACPTDAICGEVKKPHFIMQEKCVKCGVCHDKCKFSAINIG
ncbi:MAG: NADH-quinone oxidoreductase subunit NuoF [Lachnospiraceae bacterium]|nr:NADH-quinone oxidoreductase subunit NuoF [Lachnospiraceae bacterium]